MAAATTLKNQKITMMNANASADENHAYT